MNSLTCPAPCFSLNLTRMSYDLSPLLNVAASMPSKFPRMVVPIEAAVIPTSDMTARFGRMRSCGLPSRTVESMSPASGSVRIIFFMSLPRLSKTVRSSPMMFIWRGVEMPPISLSTATVMMQSVSSESILEISSTRSNMVQLRCVLSLKVN